MSKPLNRAETVASMALQQMAHDDFDAEAQAVVAAVRPHILAEPAPEDTSDGYHTFRELYEYRMLYHAAAARGWLAAGIPVIKSWRHHDGQRCFGGEWFIVTADLPTGQVSNHYPADSWDLFAVPKVETGPTWDGHTPADAADRLRSWLTPEANHA